ncbi:hypothetical protein LIER_29024 [Lithospermum erythrorhizon]|uniref:Uncharacterized protein n=1 Tax=Lithospermum erythrorhizon TaxID=34254 RepID=A0AAV3RKU9_LITER
MLHPTSPLMCHPAELFRPIMFDFIQKEFDACKAYSIKKDGVEITRGQLVVFLPRLTWSPGVVLILLRYEYISDLVTGAASRICYNVAAYNVLLNYVLIGIREAKKLLHSNFKTSEPSRAECSIFPVEDDIVEFPRKSIKQRYNPNKSKVC